MKKCNLSRGVQYSSQNLVHPSTFLYFCQKIQFSHKYMRSTIISILLLACGTYGPVGGSLINEHVTFQNININNFFIDYRINLVNFIFAIIIVT